MTRRGIQVLGLCAVASVLPVWLGTAGAGRAVQFTDARLKVEINATDGDAGLQIFLDGQPWNSARLSRPDGQTILNVDVTGPVANFGFTEYFSESSEPPFTTFPLTQFKQLFPAGKYTFTGTTTDGSAITATATLTHDFPDGPRILSPVADTRLARDQVTVSWAPVITPVGIRIAGYQVLVVQEKPVLRVFSADLPATASRLPIPAEFLQPNIDYKVEVLAIEAGGNQTLSELTFTVR